MSDSPFDSLVGGELHSVSFVRDYVELRVDYSIVRLLADPFGRIDGEDWRLSSGSAADVLRRYIGRTVMATEFDEYDHLRLHFDDGSFIDASLRDDARVGPEALHFLPADAGGTVHVEDMWVW